MNFMRTRLFPKTVMILTALLGWTAPVSGYDAYNPSPDPSPNRCDDCESDTCSSSASSYPASAANQSVHLTFHLGRAPMERGTNYTSQFVLSGQALDEPGIPESVEDLDALSDENPVTAIWPVRMWLIKPRIAADCFEPEFRIATVGAYVTILREDDEIRQILTSDFLVVIDALPQGQEGFTVKWWRNQERGSKVDGFYQPQGDPVKTVTVSNPTPFQDYEFMDVALEIDMGASTKYLHYRYSNETNAAGNLVQRMQTWTTNPATPGAQQIASDDLEYLSGAPEVTSTGGSFDPVFHGVDQVRIRTIMQADVDASGSYGSLTLISRIREVYRHIGGKRLISETRLNSPTTTTEGLTTLYGYVNKPADSRIHGRRRFVKYPDGSWKSWLYEVGDTSQTVVELSPVSSAQLIVDSEGGVSYTGGDLRSIATTTTASDLSITEKVGGTIVSRREKHIVTEEDQNSGQEQLDSATLQLLALGCRVVREREYYGASGSAYLETTQVYYPLGATPYPDGPASQDPQGGRLAYETTQDRNHTLYEYPSFRTVKITSKSEVGTIVTTTTYNGFWTPVSQSKTRGTAMISSWVVTQEDLYGRPERVEYDGDPNDYETTEYSCCGPSEKRRRDGSIIQYFYDRLNRVVKTIEKGGSYDTGVVTYVDRLGLKTTRSFGLEGFAPSFELSASEVDLLGNEVKLWAADADGVGGMELTTISKEYLTEGGTRVTETNPLGGTVITTIYPSGKLKSIAGTATDAVSYEYGAHSKGEFTRMIRANGTEWVESYYNFAGQMIEERYADGNARKWGYYRGQTLDPDFNRRPSSFSDTDTVALGATPDQVYAYGRNSNYGLVTTVTEKTLDGEDRLRVTSQDFVETATVHGVVFGPAYVETISIKDDAGDPGIVVEERFRSVDGRTRASVSFGRETISFQTLPDDGQWTETTIHPDGTETVATYIYGRLWSEIHYDTGGSNAIWVKWYSYDTLHRLSSVLNSQSGQTVIGGFRDNGSVISRITNNETTSYVHDALGRVIETVLPDNSSQFTSYTATGRVEAVWGSQIYPTFRTYDGQGRMATLRTQPTLDSNGVPTNAGGSLTTWTYSPTRGFLTRKEYHDGNGTDYTYTPAGRLQTRTWARGVVTTYGYDRGLLETVSYTNDPANTPGVVYDYDVFGRVQTVTQANQSVIAYTYDPATFAVDTETISYDLDHDGTTDFTRVLDRKPTDLGRAKGWELKDGSTVENETTYGYDPATGRFNQVNGGSMGTFDYSYVQGSVQLIEEIAGPVATTTNSWESGRNVLQKKENKVGTAVRSSYEYFVNALGQREGQIHDGSVLGGSDGAFSYRYNARGEIAEVKRGANPTYPSIGAVSHTWDYDYDAIGNRLTADATGSGTSGSVSYTPNALNQYTAIASLSPSYDLDGNATAYPVPASPASNANLAWDGENRLVSLTVAGTTTSYLYDAMSRRISKTTGSASTLTVYDGWNPIADFQKSGTASATLSRRYQWGLDLSGSLQGAGGVGGLLAIQISNLYYPLYDGNGNVTEYLNAAGTAAASFMYDAYGNTIRDTDTAGNFDIRFSTKRRDAESGLYYYGYRYYDPVTGRWLNRDPIEEDGGVNLYGFVENDPIDWVDVLGLEGNAPGSLYDTAEEAMDAGGRYATEGAERNLSGRQENYDKMSRSDQVGRDRPVKAWEFCGRVCKQKDKPCKYYYTKAGTTQSDSSCNIMESEECAEGDSEVGAYHNHPTRGSSLSEGDRRNARSRKKKIGATHRDANNDMVTDTYDPATGEYERFINGNRQE